MDLQEVQGVLKGILETPKDKLKVAETRTRLEECVLLLQPMPRLIPPAAPTPMMPPDEILEAKDSIEQALEYLDENDAPAMLQHVQNALAQLSKVT